jgi:hypothetical protein
LTISFCRSHDWRLPDAFGHPPFQKKRNRRGPAQACVDLRLETAAKSRLIQKLQSEG